MTKEEIEKASDDYAHNNFIMHHTNHFQALKQGFKAGVFIGQSQILEKLNQLQSENERLKAEMEWISVTPETMPKIPIINNYCVENKDLLVLHCLKFDSYEIGFWNGEKWEMPDTGFAEIWEVDMYMQLPNPPPYKQ